MQQHGLKKNSLFLFVLDTMARPMGLFFSRKLNVRLIMFFFSQILILYNKRDDNSVLTDEQTNIHQVYKVRYKSKKTIINKIQMHLFKILPSYFLSCTFL